MGLSLLLSIIMDVTYVAYWWYGYSHPVSAYANTLPDKALVQDIIFIDIAHVAHRFLADIPQGRKLHVPEPLVLIQAHFPGQGPNPAYPGRAGIVSGQGQTHPVPGPNLLRAEIAVAEKIKILHSGVNIVFHFADILNSDIRIPGC